MRDKRVLWGLFENRDDDLRKVGLETFQDLMDMPVEEISCGVCGIRILGQGKDAGVEDGL